MVLDEDVDYGLPDLREVQVGAVVKKRRIHPCLGDLAVSRGGGLRFQIELLDALKLTQCQVHLTAYAIESGHARVSRDQRRLPVLDELHLRVGAIVDVLDVVFSVMVLEAVGA